VHLGALGLKVFLDVEGLAQGSFEQGLQGSLDRSRAMVCVLSEGALDRCCSDPANKDWVRKEIAIALEAGKILIPVTYGFTWPAPETLPADIRAITSQNGVEWIHMYQQAPISSMHITRDWAAPGLPRALPRLPTAYPGPRDWGGLGLTRSPGSSYRRGGWGGGYCH
jgi:hypothetical protein